MVNRIVKLTIKKDAAPLFVQHFEERKHLIAGFEGCHGVELLQDINDERIFFTYSQWTGEDALNAYRQSELFNSVWDIVKQLFDGKPEAWTVTAR